MLAAPNHGRWFRLNAVLAALIAIRALAAILSPTGMGWDFRQYYMAGNRAFEGRMHELYKMPRSVMEEWGRAYLGSETDAIPEDTRIHAGRGDADPDELVNSGRLGYVGFPLSAYLWATFGAFPPRTGMVIFKLECALSLAIGLWLLFPAFRDGAEHRDAALPLYLAVTLLYEPFWFSFATGGQATPISFLLLILFYRSFVRNRSLLAGLWLAIGIAVKPFFIVLLPVLALARCLRAAVSTTVFLGLALGASLLMLGLPLHREWWITMEISAAGIAEPWWQNVAILGMVYTWWTYSVGRPLEMAGEPTSRLVTRLISGFKVVVVALFLFRAVQLPRQALDGAMVRHHAALLGTLLGLFFSGIIWPHYLTFLFLPLVFWLTPRNPLPRGGRLLAWLTLISTLSVHSRFAQRWVLSLLADLPLVQTAVAAVFGSVTLSLAFIFFVVYYPETLASLRGVQLYGRPDTSPAISLPVDAGDR